MIASERIEQNMFSLEIHVLFKEDNILILDYLLRFEMLQILYWIWNSDFIKLIYSITPLCFLLEELKCCDWFMIIAKFSDMYEACL